MNIVLYSILLVLLVASLIGLAMATANLIPVRSPSMPARAAAAR